MDYKISAGRVAVMLETVTVLQTLTPYALESQAKVWGNCDAYTVTFRTPTVFRHIDHYHCLPQSDLLFGGILPNSAFMASRVLRPTCTRAIYGCFAGSISIVYCSVTSTTYSKSGQRRSGPLFLSCFVGKDNPARLSLGRMLVPMPFCGVGAKTAMGLGAVEVARGSVV
jgi:hypothetical protein